MPSKWIDLPPDHPIFQGGVSFVLRDEAASTDDELRLDDDELAEDDERD
jgi:hypothetical protein